jgi:hypothetical protein
LLKVNAVAIFGALQHMVTQEAYDDLQRKYSDLEAKYERMLPLMNYLQRHLFGQSSERHVQSPSNDLQGSLFAPDAVLAP